MKTGDKVVCVKEHPLGYVEFGKIYPALGFRESCCEGLLINVGIANPRLYLKGSNILCHSGKHSWYNDGILWLSIDRFRKVDESFADNLIAELEEEINEENLILK